MKPSERIVTIAFEKHGHPLGSKIRPEHQVAALIDCLDEQHEIERRRIWLRAALSVCVPHGRQQKRFNKYAEKAVLRTRIHGNALTFCVMEELLLEAEQEGLL